MKFRNIRIIIQLFFLILFAAQCSLGFLFEGAVFIALTVLIGPLFCGWICPFGTIQDLFSGLGRKAGIEKRSFPVLDKWMKPFRYIILALFLFTGLQIVQFFLAMDSRTAFKVLLSTHQLSVTGRVSIVLFLMLSLFIDRPFCRYFCLKGAEQGLLGASRIFTVSRDESSCTGCNLCNKACPMGIDIASKKNINSLSCIDCMECVSACPQPGTLRPTFYTNPRVLALRVLAALSILSLALFAKPPSLLLDSFTKVSHEESVVGIAKGCGNGSYFGTGTGYNGDITIEVIVKDQRIVDTNVIASRDDSEWFSRAYNQILPDIIDSQSTEVDNVAGATFSSRGIKDAIDDAFSNK